MVKSPQQLDFSCYLPRLIQRWIAAPDFDDKQASSEKLHGAILFADLSGFTALTERLTADGVAGAEALTRILNDYFTQVIDIVDDCGGDVLKFAGDAMLCVFPARSMRSLEKAGLRALHCAWRVQSSLLDYRASDVPLMLRATVAVGPAAISHLGGELDRWEFIVSGPPLDECGIISDVIDPGDVGVGESVATLCGDALDMEPVSDGVLRLRSAPPELSPPPPTPAPPNAGSARLQRYVPYAVVHRLEAGLHGYLGELRLVTCVFVNLPDLHYQTPVDDAQRLMQRLQRGCYRHEGSINKLSVDDKGISLLAVWGLPPLAHHDDPRRAIHAALDMRRQLADLGLSGAFGVATGRVYCGVVGSDQRREYTLMGATVNLAARLMQQAGRDRILCCELSQQRCGAWALFGPCESLQLKGKADAVRAFSVLAARTVEPAGQVRLAGRGIEQGVLNDALGDLMERGTSSAIVLSGPPGMGKSRLVDWFDGQIESQKLTILRARGAKRHAITPYYMLRSVIASILDVDPTDSLAAMEMALATIVPLSGASGRPLLADVFGANGATAVANTATVGEARAERNRQILVELLASQTSSGPVVVVLDDIQWMDTASSKVLGKALGSLDNLMICATERCDDAGEGWHPRIRGAKALGIGLLDDEAMAQLVYMHLGATAVPQALVDIVTERAEGHPQFAVQLLEALRESGQLRLESGLWEWRPAEDFRIPDSVEAAITARIDRLSASLAMTLKSASVIGRRFDATLLLATDPAVDTRSEAVRRANALIEGGFVETDGPAGGCRYRFRQLLVQEVAYELLLNQQRSELHGRLGMHLLRRSSRPDDGLLSSHFAAAGDRRRAALFASRAGYAALDVFACAEAIAHFELALDQSTGLAIRPRRRGAWLRAMGQAHCDLSQLDLADACFVDALRELGEPPPKGRLGLVFGLIGQLFQQWARSALWLRSSPNRRQRQRMHEAALAHHRALIIHYWRADRLRMFYGSFRAANLADRSRESVDLGARSYANLAIVTGLVPVPKLADRFAGHAIGLMDKSEEGAVSAAPGWVNLAVGTYLTGRGELARARELFDRGLLVARAVGDESIWARLTASLTIIELLEDQRPAAYANYAELLQQGTRRDDAQAIIWGYVGTARLAFREGLFDVVAEQLDGVAAWADDLATANEIDVLSLRACLAIEGRRLDEAGQYLQDCCARLGRPGQITMYPGAQQMAYAAIRLKDPRLTKRVRKYVAKMAKIFPVARPWHQLMQCLTGRRRDHFARRDWLAARREAVEFGMPFEAQLLGRASRVEDTTRESLPDHWRALVP